MPSATINVQYVNPPKPGKKQGSIKTVDGQFFGVDPTQLSQFREGGTYTVEYDTHVYQGKEYKTFRRMEPQIIGTIPLTSPAAMPTGRPAHTQAVEMFVMGVIGRSLQGAGTVPDRETLTTWVKSLKWAWIDGFASVGKPEEPDDF